MSYGTDTPSMHPPVQQVANVELLGHADEVIE
jgi:hypothetical protein